jgi:mRNA interferase MazF
VVSEDAFNSGLSGLVMVVPLTSKVAKSRNVPAHVLVASSEGGLKTASVILCDQLRTISRNRLGSKAWGAVMASTMSKVDQILRILLRL